ncbi:MAG: hypothetical protein K9M07_02125 [Simkaniaceae bacterium]|nr:hypothetical protein [Simkaniaceae bacterium]
MSEAISPTRKLEYDTPENESVTSVSAKDKGLVLSLFMRSMDGAIPEMASQLSRGPMIAAYQRPESILASLKSASLSSRDESLSMIRWDDQQGTNVGGELASSLTDESDAIKYAKAVGRGVYGFVKDVGKSVAQFTGDSLVLLAGKHAIEESCNPFIAREKLPNPLLDEAKHRMGDRVMAVSRVGLDLLRLAGSGPDTFALADHSIAEAAAQHILMPVEELTQAVEVADRFQRVEIGARVVSAIALPMLVSRVAPKWVPNVREVEETGIEKLTEINRLGSIASTIKSTAAQVSTVAIRQFETFALKIRPTLNTFAQNFHDRMVMRHFGLASKADLNLHRIALASHGPETVIYASANRDLFRALSRSHDWVYPFLRERKLVFEKIHRIGAANQIARLTETNKNISHVILAVHGEPSTLGYNLRGVSPERLVRDWALKNFNDKAQVILVSCSTGAEMGNGRLSFAQKLQNIFDYGIPPLVKENVRKNITVISATEDIGRQDIVVKGSQIRFWQRQYDKSFGDKFIGCFDVTRHGHRIRANNLIGFDVKTEILHKDLTLVRLHKRGDEGYAGFIRASNLKKLSSLKQVRDKFIGNQKVDQVTFARIPAGEYIQYIKDRALKTERYSGGGMRYDFADFDPRWVVSTQTLSSATSTLLKNK